MISFLADRTGKPAAPECELATKGVDDGDVGVDFDGLPIAETG
jgi:hypothetical protein